MRLGTHIISFDHPDGAAGLGPRLADVGAAAEAAGVGWLSVMDHYFQPAIAHDRRGRVVTALV
ncbi:hypothetical protein QOZ89_05905 [Pseudofrankia sp. BMG5.37]|nr:MULTISPECIES: hypothetical protein [unclassified Pseudofrankia]MDT3439145.1 hypothetical protein [Pseudofrankia sp. BMG5.37]